MPIPPPEAPNAQDVEELLANWASLSAGPPLPPERLALLARERLRLAAAAASMGTPDFASEPGTSHRLVLRRGGA